MNKTIKLSLILGLSTSLFAISSIDKKVIDYQKSLIEKNYAYTLHSLKLDKVEALDENKKWNAYKITLDLTQKKNDKRFTAPMMVFSNGTYITSDLRNINTGARYGEDAQKTAAAKKRNTFEKTYVLPDTYYKEDHVIAGNHNAKNKVVIFSDPLCVFCIRHVPGIIESIKGRNDIALYYYDFPLDMHPTAKTVVKAIIKAKKDGLKDVELKIYKADFEKFYDVYKTIDPKQAITAFNKIMDTKYTVSDIETTYANEHMESDIFSAIEANVQGTPTISFNGSFSNGKIKLDEFIKNN